VKGGFSRCNPCSKSRAGRVSIAKKISRIFCGFLGVMQKPSAESKGKTYRRPPSGFFAFLQRPIGKWNSVFIGDAGVLEKGGFRV